MQAQFAFESLGTKTPCCLPASIKSFSAQTWWMSQCDDWGWVLCRRNEVRWRGRGWARASDSRGGFRGRGQRPQPPRPRPPPMSGTVQPRSADVWRRAGGRRRRSELQSSPAGSRSHTRASVDDARPRSINRRWNSGGGGARYSGTRAVLASQVPEVARAAAARASSPAADGAQQSDRRTPIVLHQVLWCKCIQALVGVHLPCRWFPTSRCAASWWSSTRGVVSTWRRRRRRARESEVSSRRRRLQELAGGDSRTVVDRRQAARHPSRPYPRT